MQEKKISGVFQVATKNIYTSESEFSDTAQRQTSSLHSDFHSS